MQRREGLDPQQSHTLGPGRNDLHTEICESSHTASHPTGENEHDSVSLKDIGQVESWGATIVSHVFFPAIPMCNLFGCFPRGVYSSPSKPVDLGDGSPSF